MKNYTLTLLGIGASLGVSAFAVAADAAPKKPKAPKTHHLSFVQADVNGDGALDVFEFAKTQGPGTPLAQIRKRFLPIDTSGAFTEVIDPVTQLPAVDPVTGEPVQGDPIPDGLVTPEELSAYKALEEKPKSTLGRFQLADFDGDGQLTPVELGYLVSPKVKFSKVMRKFDKLDRNDDGFLSTSEFKKAKLEDL